MIFLPISFSLSLSHFPYICIDNWEQFIYPLQIPKPFDVECTYWNLEKVFMQEKELFPIEKRALVKKGI